MKLKKWNQLPQYMQTEEVRPYYDYLSRKKISLVLKRLFDLILATILLIILAPVMIILALLIKVDSPVAVIFKQERVTQYGRKFNIYKFRTMVNNADNIGYQVTINNDSRITRMGNLLRKSRFDEFPQLFNVILGDMSFVGTRPEVYKFVKNYTNEMYATLLLPAGITSEASINYKDEDELLSQTDNVEYTYMNEVLPNKMRYNFNSINNFSLYNDLKTILKTFTNVFL